MAEIKLDQMFESPAAGAALHDVVLDLTVVQDGAPFLESKTSYHHCSDLVAGFIVNNLASMAGALGPKGKKPKSGPFTVSMKISQDGSQVASGDWDSLTREQVLVFERQVLDIWGHMNQQGVVQAKAFGKI